MVTLNIFYKHGRGWGRGSGPCLLLLTRGRGYRVPCLHKHIQLRKFSFLFLKSGIDMCKNYKVNEYRLHIFLTAAVLQVAFLFCSCWFVSVPFCQVLTHIKSVNSRQFNSRQFNSRQKLINSRQKPLNLQKKPVNLHHKCNNSH